MLDRTRPTLAPKDFSHRGYIIRGAIKYVLAFAYTYPYHVDRKVQTASITGKTLRALPIYWGRKMLQQLAYHST